MCYCSEVKETVARQESNSKVRSSIALYFSNEELYFLEGKLFSQSLDMTKFSLSILIKRKLFLVERCLRTSSRASYLRRRRPHETRRYTDCAKCRGAFWTLSNGWRRKPPSTCSSTSPDPRTNTKVSTSRILYMHIQVHIHVHTLRVRLHLP